MFGVVSKMPYKISPSSKHIPHISLLNKYWFKKAIQSLVSYTNWNLELMTYVTYLWHILQIKKWVILVDTVSLLCWTIFLILYCTLQKNEKQKIVQQQFCKNLDLLKNWIIFMLGLKITYMNIKNIALKSFTSNIYLFV